MLHSLQTTSEHREPPAKRPSIIRTLFPDCQHNLGTTSRIHSRCYTTISHKIDNQHTIGRHQELGSRSHVDRRLGNIAAQENCKIYTVDLRNGRLRLKHNRTCAQFFYLSDALHPYDSCDLATIHLYAEEPLHNEDLTTGATSEGIYHGVCEATLAIRSESFSFALHTY